MLNKVRSGEVDTPEEVAKAINKLIDEIKAMTNISPSLGEVVVISEDGNFYPGVAVELHEDNSFEVEFFDGDDGCYGVEDLACNAEKKGAKDA